MQEGAPPPPPPCEHFVFLLCLRASDLRASLTARIRINMNSVIELNGFRDIYRSMMHATAWAIQNDLLQSVGIIALNYLICSCRNVLHTGCDGARGEWEAVGLCGIRGVLRC